MKPFTATVKRLLTSALAGAALLTFIGAGSAGGQVMLRVPDQSPGMPGYAYAARPFVWHTEQWAAIVFIRPPNCVPPSFNLLDLYDPPAPPDHPGAFACPLTVSGFELRDTPDINAEPRQAVNHGIAVAVWFVDWTVFQAAIADNVLTMPELELLAPLKGIATTYHEVLHPMPTEHMTIIASGFLADGRWFQYEFNAPEYGKVKHVRIEIR